MKRKAQVSTIERALALLATAYLVGTANPFLNGLHLSGKVSIEGSARGNLAAQLAGAVVYGSIAIVFLRSGSTAIKRMFSNPALNVFVVLMLVSVLWSASPGVSLRRLTGVLGCLMVAAYLAVRFQPEEVIALVGNSFGIAVGVSVALSLLLPSVGGQLFDAPGGVWGHKNDLGRAMVFSVIVSWSLLFARRHLVNPWLLAGLLVTSLFLVAVSRSAQSALVTTVSLTLIWPLVWLVSRRNRRFTWRVLAGLLFVVAIGILLVEVASDSILAALGRDSTLTDRTVIWELVSGFGWERPWLGHGYAAFWTSRGAYAFGDRWGDLDHAHNGFLDLWLELGFVGLFAFGVLLVSAQRRAWDAALADRGSAARFLPVFLVAAIMLNTVGHVFPEHNSIYWTLLCYAALLPPAGRPRISNNVFASTPALGVAR